MKTDIVVSEIPAHDVYYDALDIRPANQSESINIDIEIERRHAQIQIALYTIGKQLQYQTWIAQNDKSIVYKGKRIEAYEGVLQSLDQIGILSPFKDAIHAARLIDCIWFKGDREIPAVMEIEHSTGVVSGLTRMKNFQDLLPSVLTRYVIVAPDALRKKVMTDACRQQFEELKTFYLSYSAVEELYDLCQRRAIRGITETFLECFMEPVVS